MNWWSVRIYFKPNFFLFFKIHFRLSLVVVSIFFIRLTIQSGTTDLLALKLTGISQDSAPPVVLGIDRRLVGIMAQKCGHYIASAAQGRGKTAAHGQVWERVGWRETIRKKSGRKRYKRSVHLNTAWNSNSDRYEYPNINTILTLMRPVHCATPILNALDILSVLPTRIKSLKLI